MSVRRRILLAALAVVVVGTLVVLFWSAGPKDTKPKLSIGISGSTTAGGKYATVTVTNLSDQNVILSRYTILFESSSSQPMPMFDLRSLSMPPHGLATFSACLYLNLSLPRRKIVFGDVENRWRLKCFVQRERLSCKLRRALRKIRPLERYIDFPPDYEITSDWFTQT